MKKKTTKNKYSFIEIAKILNLKKLKKVKVKRFHSEIKTKKNNFVV